MPEPPQVLHEQLQRGPDDLDAGVGLLNLSKHSLIGRRTLRQCQGPRGIRAQGPGDGSPNISQGGRRWHHAFHQTLDLPEALVTGREDIYFGWFYRNYGARPLAEEDIAAYLRVYRQPGALRAGFSYYRAIPRDIADNAAIVAGGFKLPMPVLALGGDRSWGRRLEVVESLRRLAVDVQGGVVENCGHWMPEEQPAELLKRLLAFFG